MFCGLCNAHMIGISGTSKTKKLYNYYECSNKKRDKSCNKTNLSKTYIEKLVVDSTIKHILQPNRIEYIAKKCIEINNKDQQNDFQIEHLSQKLKDVNKSIANIIIMIENGTCSNSLNDRLNQLEQNKFQIEQSLKEHNKKYLKLNENHIKFLLNDILDKKTQDTDAYYDKILLTFVSHVIVSEDELLIYYNICGDNSELESSSKLLLGGDGGS